MNPILTSVGRLGVVVCIVTTCALAVFVSALALSGSLERDRVAGAVRALRGAAPEPAPVVAHSVKAAGGDLRELETLLVLSDARSADLQAQHEQIRAERRAAERAAAEKAAPTAAPTPSAGTGTVVATPVAADAAFASNLAILRSHVPRTAATLIADWSPEAILPYLRAMKPYEAADILGALLALGRRSETDYARKARELQEALGR